MVSERILVNSKIEGILSKAAEETFGQPLRDIEVTGRKNSVRKGVMREDGTISTDGEDLFTFVVEAGDEAELDLMKNPDPREVTGIGYQTWEELGRDTEAIDFDPRTLANYIAMQKGYGAVA